MRDANINVIMISQASSEHSVCFAVKMDDADKAVEVLRHRFRDAMSAGRISMVRSIDNCCVLAAVGSLMASRRGVAATMFSALAKSNVNIRYVWLYNEGLQMASRRGTQGNRAGLLRVQHHGAH